MAVVKVNWSGGKDSTCAVMLHLLRGDTVKVVCYIPMFTDTIPLLLREHYEFILNTAEKFREKGAKVYFVKGITYFDFVTKRSSRGEFKGRMFGFPPFETGKCGFNRDSKSKALNKVDIGHFDYEDIGLAIDEPERHKVLKEKRRSILCELGFTEAQAMAFCESHNLKSPYYDKYNRDGCTLCPHAPREQRVEWFKENPQALNIVLFLQELVKKERPEQTPLRNHQWFIDDLGNIA